MKLRLHHVNVVSDNMEELHQFYSEVLGLKRLPMYPMVDHIGHDRDESQPDDDDAGWGETVGFFDASGQDELQIHAGVRQAYLGPRMGQTINPLLNGHYCFRTDDLNEVREQLTKAGVPFADYGEWAVAKWDQIFLTDPAGNVIEIHQVLS